jgi:hypothetical protein
MSMNRRNLNKRLRALRDAGLIKRYRRGVCSTAYQLNLNLIRACVGSNTNERVGPWMQTSPIDAAIKRLRDDLCGRLLPEPVGRPGNANDGHRSAD